MTAQHGAMLQACAGQPAGACANKPIARMWEAWQKRRLRPVHNYTSPSTGTVYPLLSMWPSYIVHLPYFSTSSFNSDPTWSALFKSHWAADWAYYNTSAYYGGDGGRYGLAAGFTDPGAVDLVPVDLVRADGPGSVKPITITIWYGRPD